MQGPQNFKQVSTTSNVSRVLCLPGILVFFIKLHLKQNKVFKVYVCLHIRLFTFKYIRKEKLPCETFNTR